MRVTLSLLAALLGAGCWADFPPELLRPDRGHDLPSDARPDRPSDLRLDARRELRVDGPRREAGPREARPDLAPSDAIPDGRALLPLGTPCKSGSQCASNHCEPRSQLCCNAPCTGACMSCSLGGQEGRCGFVPAGTDPQGDCATSPLASCKLDGTCDGMGACRNYPAGTVVSAAACVGATLDRAQLATVCDGNGNPVSGVELLCDPYTCDPGTKRCRAGCSATGECVAGTCQAQKCNGKARSLGAACSKNPDCASAFCVDGVCCESACDQLCQRCNLAGLEGKCLPAFAGTDPDNDCVASPGPCGGLDGQCDGKGACRPWPAGTPCATASCAASQLILYGTCAAGACLKTTASCGSYACLPAGDGCYAFCSQDSHCRAGCGCNISTWSCEGSC